jgi:hypothetical protein
MFCVKNCRVLPTLFMACKMYRDQSLDQGVTNDLF